MPERLPAAGLSIPDPAERDDLANFVGRAVRLSSSTIIRLRTRPDGNLDVLAATGFDVIAARTVAGQLRPPDTTVRARELLTALAVVRGEVINPGAAIDAEWRAAVPPLDGFVHVDDLPAAVLSDLGERGVAIAREHPGPDGRPSAALLDQPVLTVAGAGEEIAVPMRCIFALVGMGFVGEGSDAPVRVRVTAGWLRLDAPYGSIIRRRVPQIPLLVQH